MQDENDELINKVANNEIETDVRTEQIKFLQQKHLESKVAIEQLKDKNRELEMTL